MKLTHRPYTRRGQGDKCEPVFSVPGGDGGGGGDVRTPVWPGGRLPGLGADGTGYGWTGTYPQVTGGQSTFSTQRFGQVSVGFLWLMSWKLENV